MKNAKRILCLVLVLCLTAGFFPISASAAGSLPFTDVAAGAWYRDSVQYVYENGIMSGTSADKFSPNVTTTRGMIVTILHRIAGSPSAVGESFSDVAPGKYYAPGVAWASSEGIVTGYGKGIFRPDSAITREQLATILYRYADYAGLDTSAEGSLGSFTDSGKVSSYAREPMSWAVGAGLISGVGEGRLDPGGSATRAQVAAIFTRFMALSKPDTESGGEAIPVGDYAIVELSVSGSSVTAALSTVEDCSIVLEVLSEDGENSLWTKSFPVSGGLELQYETFATKYNFPENFILTAVLVDQSGEELCSKFVCRRYTRAFREFFALNEADFASESDRLIDFVAPADGNFALLREDVKLLSASPERENGTAYLFASSALPAGLAQGDKLCFPDTEGRWATIIVDSVSRNGAETTIIENPNSFLDDFYEIIKLSADLAEVSGSSSGFGGSSSDKNWLSELEMGAAVKNSFEAPFGSFGHETSVGGKLEFNYGIEGWDVYLEYTIIVGVETELNLEIGPHKKLKNEIEIAEIPLAGIPDVADIPAALSLTYEVDCDAGFDTTLSVEAATGVVYNSLDGSQKVEQKTVSMGQPKLEGEVEAKFGLLAEIKAEVFDGKLSASLGAEGGAKISAKAETPLPPIPGSDSCHACLLCADGSVGGYFEAGLSADYELSFGIEGSIIELDFLYIDWIVSQFYLSLANEAESVHGGKIVCDTGKCPNNKYRAGFSTLYNGKPETGVIVDIVRSQILADYGASPYETYLYPGSYSASATISGKYVEKGFSVSDGAVSVALEAKDCLVQGKVSDKDSGKAISGATVMVKNAAGEIVADAFTDGSGEYAILLPSGDYSFSFEADGYESASAELSLSSDKTLNIALEKIMATVTGTVTDKESGKPISGAAVKATGSDGKSYSATTDAEGRYTLELPAGDRYSMSFSADGYEKSDASVGVESGGEFRKDAALKPLSRKVTIEVVCWGSPYAGASVEIPDIGKYTTGDDGTVTIDIPESVADGNYLIIAKTREYYGNATLSIPGSDYIKVDAFMLIH